MRRRGFTLIEVLLSLAIFALAAVGLAAAYSNVLLGRAALRQDEQDLEDMSRVRAALMENPSFELVETGGEVHLPGDRLARWKGKIEPTTVSDLFTVTLTAEIQPQAGGDFGAPRTETRLLLRPSWSVAADRAKIRDEVRQRLERERGYTESMRTTTPTAAAPAPGKGGKPGQGAGGKPGGRKPATKPEANPAPKPGAGQPAPARRPQ